jgi:nitric oxide reductase activation protein
VYRDLRRNRRDLGVLVLVDGSGSTSRRPGDGRSVAKLQLEAAAALIYAFEILGDRVACHAFRSHGRRRVELTSLKRFEQRFDATVRAKLSGVRPEGFTRLGAAIRHSAQMLVDRSGSRRWLLIVLSDGFPFDAGYEEQYASADVSRALAEVRHAGVGALCLGIGTTTPDTALRAVFGAATYATGPGIDRLGADLATLVRAALDGADRSRRVSVR